jgi:SAM-dependent methyltransferase
VIRELPPIAIGGHHASGIGSPDHPMRIVTRQAAGLDDGDWTSATRERVNTYFDGLAAEWHTRSSPERAAIVADALDRGGPFTATARAVEVGSGIGAYTPMLAQRFGAVASVELSWEMLLRTPPTPGLRVRADATRLPVPDRSFDAVVLINMFLFPDEVDRVLAGDGAVVWVNSSGATTPIHLPPHEVEGALPGDWDCVTARAGDGEWCVLRRAG